MTKHISDEQITLQEPAVAVPSQQNEEAGMPQSPTENNMPKHKARVWLDVVVMLLMFRSELSRREYDAEFRF